MSDDAEFGAALVALLPKMRRYAGSLTHNDDAADDLVQTAALTAWRRRDKFKRGTDLRAWLFTIVHNERIDWHRRESSRLRMNIDALAHTLRAHTAPDASVLAAEVGEILASMDGGPRRAILGAANGCAYQEIADAEGVPIGTVRSRLSRGRAMNSPKPGDLTMFIFSATFVEEKTNTRTSVGAIQSD